MSGFRVDYDFFSGPAGRKRQSDRAQPGGPILRCALLIKRLRLGAIDKTFQNDRSILNPRQRSRSDGEIILNKFELGDFYLRRKIQLLRVRDLDFLPVDRQDFASRFFCHKARLPPIIIVLGEHKSLAMNQSSFHLTSPYIGLLALDNFRMARHAPGR